MENLNETSAFGFEGSWKEFAPIAFTNLLLTFVTLGIYRFWATTRERKYLWSRTRFIDDNLEWTGTGKELFLGFLTVLFGLVVIGGILIGGFFLLVQKGSPGLAMIPYALFIIGVFYLGAVARFRMIRYRLGRTYWRGIRGGSNEQGFAFGWSYMWKMAVGSLVLGLLIPWAMVDLWNRRWGRMSFGPHEFDSFATGEGLMPRFLLIYSVPIILMVLSATLMPDNVYDQEQVAAYVEKMNLMVILLYALGGIAYLFFYAAFLRNAVEGLRLHTLDFRFTARTWDWIKLFLGDVGLVIVTLGIGLIFLSYRHWKFFVTHMEAYGEVDLNELTQSTTTRAKHGEGLFDALDVGAI